MITKEEFTETIKDNGFECCYKDMSRTYELGIGDIERVYNTIVKKLNLAPVVLPNDSEGTLVCDDCNQKVKMITYTEVFPSCGCDDEN